MYPTTGFTYEPTPDQQASNERETLITLALSGNQYWINRLNAAIEKQRKEEAQEDGTYPSPIIYGSEIIETIKQPSGISDDDIPF